jgi:hypothetical protein
MEAHLPEFDSKTLLHLTKQIEGNLKNPTGKSSNTPRPPKVKREKKPKTPAVQQPGEAPLVAVTPTAPRRNGQDAGKKRRPDSGQPNGSGHAKQNVNTIELGRRGENNNAVADPRLEEEVIALGGEPGDLELILEAVSDSEMEGVAVPSSYGLQKGLEKDLHRLVMDLGIQNLEEKELASSPEAEEGGIGVIARTNTGPEARGKPSVKAAEVKQPRNSTSKGSYKLVNRLR